MTTTARQATLASLADEFGRCLLANSVQESGHTAFPAETKYRRLRKIARLMDRLSRRPAGFSWERRAERIHREIFEILPHTVREVRPVSLWAVS
jgi:hypothetical protein